MSEDQPAQKDKPLSVLILWSSGERATLRGEQQGGMARATEQLLGIAEVANALMSQGFRVADVDIEDSLERVRDALLIERPQVVYNLVYDPVIPLAGDRTTALLAYLEWHGVAYTGSSSMCLMLCQDRARTRSLLRSAHLPVFVGEQGAGRRVAAVVIGGPSARVLPLVELCPHARKPWQLAGLDDRAAAAVRELAARAFQELGCRDLAQIDIHLDERAVPSVVEVRPLVDLGTRSAFAEAAAHAERGFAGVIGDIALMAASRSASSAST